MGNKRWIASALVVIALFLGGIALAEGLTGDEILAQMKEVFSGSGNFGEEGILLRMSAHTEEANGVITESQFGVFGKMVIDSGKSEESDEVLYILLYFLGGDEEGSILLTVSPEDPSEKARIWLYLPALEMTKELISEEEQEMNFAGTTMSYGDIAGSIDLANNYTAKIASEGTIDIAETEHAVWVLDLTKRADTKDDVDYPTMTLWVDKEEYITLRMRGFNEQGDLEMEMEILALGEFEGELTVEKFVKRDYLEGKTTTTTLQDWRRPDGGLPLSIFDPETLAEFDPTSYGL